MPLLDVMKPWHDFFVLFGTASATLIGLLFVAASVGSGFLDETKDHALRSFWSPSVVHFTSILVACLLAVCPLQNGLLFAVLVSSDGLFGFVYAIVVFRRMVRNGLTASIDLEDRMLYAVLPAVAYVIMTAAGITLVSQTLLGCDVLAVSLGLLLLIGIRDAWDITVWTVMRRRN